MWSPSAMCLEFHCCLRLGKIQIMISRTANISLRYFLPSSGGLVTPRASVLNTENTKKLRSRRCKIELCLFKKTFKESVALPSEGCSPLPFLRCHLLLLVLLCVFTVFFLLFLILLLHEELFGWPSQLPALHIPLRGLHHDGGQAVLQLTVTIKV